MDWLKKINVLSKNNKIIYNYDFKLYIACNILKKTLYSNYETILNICSIVLEKYYFHLIF